MIENTKSPRQFISPSSSHWNYTYQEPKTFPATWIDISTHHKYLHVLSCLLFPGFPCFHLFLFQCASVCSFRVILGLSPLFSSVMGEYPMNLIGLFLSRLFSLKVTFLRPQVGHLVYSFHFPAICICWNREKYWQQLFSVSSLCKGAYKVRLERLTSKLINFKNYCYNTAYSRSQQWFNYRVTQLLARICLRRRNFKSEKSGNELVAFRSTGIHTTSI